MEATKQTTEQYIQKALESEELLTVIEFVKTVNYPIDNFMIDKFWASMEEDKLIYVDDTLVTWMGYSGEATHTRKAHFMKLLPKDGYKYLAHYEYENHLKTTIYPMGYMNIYPPLPTGRGSTSTKHLLLTPKCLKIMMMRTSTSKGDQVREYYFALEELFKTYIKYQNQHKTKKDTLMLEKVQIQLLEQNTKIEEEIRKQTQQLEQEKQQALAIAKAAEEKIKEQELTISRYETVNKDLTLYKKFIGREETLYVLTSKSYAPQGLFKIGRTRANNANNRLISMNTGRTVEDSLFVAIEYKTHSSDHLERRIHHLLQHYRDTKDREWFKLPFNTIKKVIELADDHYCEEQELMNKITELVNAAQIAGADMCWDMGVVYPLEAPPQLLSIEGPDPQYLIPEFKLTEEAAIALVERILSSLSDARVLNIKCINELIKAQPEIKPKNKFRASSWFNLLNKVSQNKGLQLKKR